MPSRQVVPVNHEAGSTTPQLAGQIEDQIARFVPPGRWASGTKAILLGLAGVACFTDPWVAAALTVSAGGIQDPLLSLVRSRASRRLRFVESVAEAAPDLPTAIEDAGQLLDDAEFVSTAGRVLSIVDKSHAEEQILRCRNILLGKITGTLTGSPLEHALLLAETLSEDHWRFLAEFDEHPRRFQFNERNVDFEWTLKRKLYEDLKAGRLIEPSNDSIMTAGRIATITINLTPFGLAIKKAVLDYEPSQVSP